MKKEDDRKNLLIDDSLPPREVEFTPEEEEQILEELRESGLLEKE